MSVTYMVIGAYTFAKNPSAATIPKKQRNAHEIETLGGVAFFSWGASLAGVIVTLKWDYMLTAQFNSIQSLLEADAQTTFQPGNGVTYNVQLLRLNGEYFLDNTAAAELRRDVTLEMIIISQVT